MGSKYLEYIPGSECNYTAKCKILNVNRPKETLKRFCCRPRGTVLIESTQIRWFSEQSDGRLDFTRVDQRYSRLS
jgi:hypothetical protein